MKTFLHENKFISNMHGRKQPILIHIKPLPDQYRTARLVPEGQNEKHN